MQLTALHAFFIRIQFYLSHPDSPAFLLRFATSTGSIVAPAHIIFGFVTAACCNRFASLSQLPLCFLFLFPQECIQMCREQDACASATFDYATGSCHLWRPGSSSSSSSSIDEALAAAGGIAFKTWASTYGPDDKPSGSDGNGGNPGGGDYYGYNPPDYPNPPPPPSDWYDTIGQRIDNPLQPQSLGSGYFTFWPNATAALASIMPGVLVTSVADTLSSCTSVCTMDSLCTGAVFGAYDASSGAIAELTPGVKCMRLKGTVVAGDPRRTLVKAKTLALR
jgi:hypothetical protein